MTPKLFFITFFSGLFALVIDFLGYPVPALGWILISTISLISLAESGGLLAKIGVTASLGVIGFFIYANAFGISGAPQGNVLIGLETVAEAIHLEIFIFLLGLYLVVNTFSYSGIIGDLAWRIVRRTKGNLGHIMIAIMLLTCVLSGIFDGATITSIMGIVTLTILLSSGMQVKHIVKIMLLLVIATNIGGVWFVLGEPTNILAAEKLKLSPLFFLQYAMPFSIPAALLCAFGAWLIVKKYPRIKSDRPEIEVLLEGISLRRTHTRSGTLEDTLRSLGTIELRHMTEMQRIIEEEGIPDFEAALKAGVPRDRVYEALSINLNSEELALGLIDYYQYREEDSPMADLLLGDLLCHVRDEYASRLSSRFLVICSGIVLVVLLGVHAFIPALPTWASTMIAGVLAIMAVQRNARLNILGQTWHNLMESFFLIAIFATISEINYTGAFERLGTAWLSLAGPEITAGAILSGSALFSAFADNVAVMDVLTNLIKFHADWSFFALAAIVGTALGGFCSPIASVQAVIMATLLRRVAKVGFGEWILKTLPYFLILLVVSLALLWAMYALGLPPRASLPV